MHDRHAARLCHVRGRIAQNADVKLAADQDLLRVDVQRRQRRLVRAPFDGRELVDQPVLERFVLDLTPERGMPRLLLKLAKRRRGDLSPFDSSHDTRQNVFPSARNRPLTLRGA